MLEALGESGISSGETSQVKNRWFAVWSAVAEGRASRPASHFGMSEDRRRGAPWGAGNGRLSGSKIHRTIDLSWERSRRGLLPDRDSESEIMSSPDHQNGNYIIEHWLKNDILDVELFQFYYMNIRLCLREKS